MLNFRLVNTPLLNFDDLTLASKFFSSFHFGSNSIYNIDIYADDTTLHFSDLWNQLMLAFNFILPLSYLYILIGRGLLIFMVKKSCCFVKILQITLVLLQRSVLDAGIVFPF